jgi:RHS repeat-associated protein
MAVYIAAGLLYPNPIPTSGYVGTFYYRCVSGGSSYFADVAPTNAFCPAVNYIASQNITGGCDNVPDYCPSGTVLESQMILFLHAAWPSFLYVPRGTIYTFRNSSDRLATEMTSTAGSISCVNTSTPPDFPVATTPTRDNAFLGNLLVASYDSSALGGTVGWTYYHSDHLGTPRYITGVEGPFSPKYWPYGEEVTQNTTSQKLRFATMERDLETNRFFDHARSHDFNLGRFVSVDRVSGEIEDPQSWNRYAYAKSNPLLYIDPTGEAVELIGSSEEERRKAFAELQKSVGAAGSRLYINEVKEGDKTRYFVGINGSVGDFKKLSSTAGGLASLIGDKRVVEFGLTSNDLSRQGGAVTYEPGEVENQNVRVLINPNQVDVANRVLNPNSLLGATRFGGWDQNPRWVINPFTAEINTWHEFGHAWGFIHGKPMSETSPDALRWENRMRQMTYGPIGPSNAPRVVH